MDLNNLTEGQKEFLRTCESPEEALKAIQEEGIDLTDDQLEAVSGGVGWGASSADYPS